MDPIELDVAQPAPICLSRDVDLALHQAGVAPAALAAAAVGRSFDPGALHRPEQTLVGFAGDHHLFPTDINRQRIALADLILGIIRIVHSAHVVAAHLHTIAPLRQAQLFALLLAEDVHGLRAAHKDGVFALRRILLNPP